MAEEVTCLSVNLRASSGDIVRFSQLIADRVWYHASPELLRRKWEVFDSYGYALYAADSCLVAAGVLISDNPLRENEHDWEIDSLAVAHPRQGYGSILLQRMEDEAQKAGAEALSLDSRKSACGFWLKRGYIQLGETSFRKALVRDDLV